MFCRRSLKLECILVLRSEEHTSELQSPKDLVCRLLLEKKTERGYHVQQPEGVPTAEAPLASSTANVVVSPMAGRVLVASYMDFRPPGAFFFFKKPAPPRNTPLSLTAPFHP